VPAISAIVMLEGDLWIAWVRDIDWSVMIS